MFRSRAVAYVKPSCSCRTLLILGMRNGFLTICLLISLKWLTTHMVLSFFGMMKVGEAHSESACHFKTPKSHSLWTSFLRFPHAFLVLGMVCHDVVVLPLFYVGFYWAMLVRCHQDMTMSPNFGIMPYVGDIFSWSHAQSRVGWASHLSVPVCL